VIGTAHIGNVTLYLGDCREVLPTIKEAIDAVVTDPPYGVTGLPWDVATNEWAGWLPCSQFWCFGSLKYFLQQPFAGWRLAQEIVWEKHNGTSLHNDRFRRVHELAAHFYRGDWATLYKSPVHTRDATARAVRRKRKPEHWGQIGAGHYVSQDGAPRLMRSVFYAKSCHGEAIHPTQKPVAVLRPLIEYSCPPGGTVLDPFAGSASGAIASIETGRKFIGIELERANFDAACQRVDAYYQQGRLFA
jgi:site-specific DNA-methyltransferase (adenine-specific)